jgi:excisionase family DNA binding protein
MENVVFTQLSIPEIREILRQELHTYFTAIQQHEQPEQDQLLTIQEAAHLINLAVPTVYGLVSKSEIPVCKKGKRLYFSKLELMEWVKSGRKKTVSEISAAATNYLNSKNG